MESKTYLLEFQLLSYRFLGHFDMTSRSRRSSYLRKKSKVGLINLDIDYGFDTTLCEDCLRQRTGMYSSPVNPSKVTGTGHRNIPQNVWSQNCVIFTRFLSDSGLGLKERLIALGFIGFTNGTLLTKCRRIFVIHPTALSLLRVNIVGCLILIYLFSELFFFFWVSC